MEIGLCVAVIRREDRAHFLFSKPAGKDSQRATAALRRDLPAHQERFNTVRLVWYPNFALAYTLQVSDNGSDWTTVASVTDKTYQER